MFVKNNLFISIMCALVVSLIVWVTPIRNARWVVRVLINSLGRQAGRLLKVNIVLCQVFTRPVLLQYDRMTYHGTGPAVLPWR